MRMAQRWPRKLTLDTKMERTTHANKGEVQVGILYGPRLDETVSNNIIEINTLA
jgi:hypothetical protein